MEQDGTRSDAACEASRRNGRKSRGPVTRKGRQISSRNAFKHGLRARQTSTPQFLPEWVQAIEQKITSYYSYIGPRRREFLDRLAPALLSTLAADRLIATELARVMAGVAALGGAEPQKAGLDLRVLEQLLFYRNRFSAARDRCLGRIVADGEVMPFDRKAFGRKARPLRPLSRATV